MGWVALVWMAACALDPGELPEDCDPRVLGPGEVRAKRIACEEELIPGGEGRVDDWLIENAVARFVVRDSYASLTQLGEEGGTLIDAIEVGGDDLLMELVPEGVRSPIWVETTADDWDGPEVDEASIFAGDVEYRLAADSAELHLVGPDGLPDSLIGIGAVWVPRPGVEHTQVTARNGGSFAGIHGLHFENVGQESLGQMSVAIAGFVVSEGEWYVGAGAPSVGIDADEVASLVLNEWVVDRIPVIDGAMTTGVNPSYSLLAERPGCVYDGLVKLGCGGLSVRVRDDHGADLAATVHFVDDDFPLAVGGGRAPLGVKAGEVWVWAGPRYGAWHGWFSGGEDDAEVVLPLVMPAEVEWPEDAGPGAPAAWASGGAMLAALAAEVAPDADHALYSEDALHALRAVGVGWANLIADDEVPVVTHEVHDDVILTVGTRSLDVWAWGASSTTRRAAHGAPERLGFGALDRLTLVRGGAGADRFTLVNSAWVTAAYAEAPLPWTWPVAPDALWLDSLADLPALDALASAWIDVQPVADRTWLPYSGAPNFAVASRALVSRTASAGNGPRVDVAWRTPPFGMPFETLAVSMWAPGWMGPPVVTAHTDLGNFPVSLDASGRAELHLRDHTWVYVTVEAPRSLPWGGDPAWAVSALRWVGMPELGPPAAPIAP
ncbi:hypothetical protein LBMAG42_53750 [Deltaproteobacteria bacterium]|nr:hypothetical protein LBMAG42_53750 [Deltaproteobacteria bacterium]